MSSSTGQKAGRSAKEVATWTQASLLTVGSSLRSAGSSFLTGIRHGYEQLTLDHSDKERVVFVKFGSLEFHQPSGAAAACPVLLLAYEVGFQVWSLRDAVKEIASRREGEVRCLESMPLPLEREQHCCKYLRSWPLVALVSDEREQGAEPGAEALLPVSCVKLYSLQSHSYIHSIAVPGRVLSLACSQRVLLVAMSTQIMAYSLSTMAVSYSAITYPAPSLRLLGDGGPTPVPLALGARWLAHASNQRVNSSLGVATPQPLRSSHARANSGSSNMDAVQHYAALAAKTSGRHIKSIGEAGYKYFSSQAGHAHRQASKRLVHSSLQDAQLAPPTSLMESPGYPLLGAASQMESWRGASPASMPSSPSSAGTTQPEDAEVVGTVVVRDLVSRTAIAHFRAHTSPLLLMRFDGAGGALLVTASVHGHTVNVFHIAAGGRAGGGGGATHLFRLSRGMTPAVIQDVGFSRCGHWLCVSSARVRLAAASHVPAETSPQSWYLSAEPQMSCARPEGKQLLLQGTTHVFRLSSPRRSNGQPPHLAAAASKASDGAAHPPVRLFPAGRARPGGLLNGSIPGSAAASAAVNLYNGTQGSSLVSSCFIERPATALFSQSSLPDPPAASDDLLVASNDGLLVRHRLLLSRPQQPSASPREPTTGSQPDMPEEDGAEVVIEAEEQWDVCRRRNWPEREDFPGEASDSSGDETEAGQREPWVAQAETNIPRPGGSAPVWADAQFHILEMQTSGAPPGVGSNSSTEPRGHATDGTSGCSILRLEAVPTRRVDIGGKAGLAPVITEGAETAVLRGAPPRGPQQR